MKQRLGRLLVVFGISWMTLVPIAVSADTITRSEIITVTATVAPARDIIIDNNGVIQQIVSNNKLPDITPLVFTNSILPSNEVPLTPDVAQQYKFLMRGLTIKPGTIYRRQTAAAAPKPTQRPYFSFTSVMISGLVKRAD